MPTVQHARRELYIKLVYYGTGLSGKTTNVQALYRRARPEHRGKLLSLEGESERTIFFDLLPVDLGQFRGYQVRLHLCTVPGQTAFDRTRRMVLRNADGIVFVVDSQAAQLENNIASLRNLDINLRLQGTDPTRLPLVVQYNKRDLRDVLSVSTLRHYLGVPAHTPQFEASALRGAGVAETLKAIVKSTLSLVGEPAKMANGRSQCLRPAGARSLLPLPVSEVPPDVGPSPAALRTVAWSQRRDEQWEAPGVRRLDS